MGNFRTLCFLYVLFVQSGDRFKWFVCDKNWGTQINKFTRSLLNIWRLYIAYRGPAGLLLPIKDLGLVFDTMKTWKEKCVLLMVISCHFTLQKFCRTWMKVLEIFSTPIEHINNLSININYFWQWKDKQNKNLQAKNTPPPQIASGIWMSRIVCNVFCCCCFCSRVNCYNKVCWIYCHLLRISVIWHTFHLTPLECCH